MRRGGFTIVELLVVIAILVILAALLFPVLASAQRSAKETQCVSTVKDMYNAALLYAADHEPIRKPHPEVDLPYDALARPELLLPFLGNDRQVLRCPAAPKCLESMVTTYQMVVPAEASLRPGTPGYAAYDAQVKKFGPQMHAIRCRIHDEFHYATVDGPVDPSVAQPFLIAVTVTGSAVKGRSGEHVRTRTFRQICSSLSKR